MKLAAIFGLSVRHAYYADGVCPDFAVEPTSDTERLLRNYRCVLKPRNDGVLVVAELAGNGVPLITVANGLTFRFNLRFRNSEFPLFTDLSAVSQQAAPRFVAVSADVSKGGPLTLGTGGAPLESGVFAVIEIPGSIFAAPSAWPVQFTVDFRSRHARWMYYCVTDLKLTGKDLRLVDIGTQGPPLVFSPTNRTDLAQSPDSSDALAVQLPSRYPSLAQMRFVSDDVVPCLQSPRSLSLQLDGHNFSDVLPTPSLRNSALWPAAAQGTQPQQDALFQVVKYVSYSFSKNGV